MGVNDPWYDIINLICVLGNIVRVNAYICVSLDEGMVTL